MISSSPASPGPPRSHHPGRHAAHLLLPFSHALSLGFLSRLSGFRRIGDAPAHAPAVPSSAAVGLCLGAARRSRYRQFSAHRGAPGRTLVGKGSRRHPSPSTSHASPAPAWRPFRMSRQPGARQLLSLPQRTGELQAWIWRWRRVPYRATAYCWGMARAEALESIAGPTVSLWAAWTMKRSPPSMRVARLSCSPAKEDFGITPLEAMAAGRPVIAYGRGGVLDSVADGETGIFFERQT